MKNLINTIALPEEAKYYGIYEIIVVDGEVHITSMYDLPHDIAEKIESEVLESLIS